MKEATTLQEAEKYFATHQEQIDNAPHPTFGGKSLNEYITWMWDHAGVTGKLKAYRAVCEALSHPRDADSHR